MFLNAPADAAAQAITQTLAIITEVYILIRPAYLVIGSVLIIIAIILTLRHKPPKINAKEIGPYNPAFDPLQKKKYKEADKRRFLGMVLLLLGIIPWILEALIAWQIIK